MGEHLDQNRMTDSAVENMRAVHTVGNGIHAAVDLRDHAALDHALCNKPRHFVSADLRDQRALVVHIPQQAPRVRQQDQLFRTQRHSDLGGGGIGVDIIAALAVYAPGNGGNHRDILVGNGVVNDRRIDFYDIAHQIVLLAVDDPALGLEHIAVQPAQTNGAASSGGKRCNQVLIDLAAQDHLDNIHRLLVRIAQAVDKFALLADLIEHVVDLRPAAVDDDSIDADQLQ